MASEDTQTVVQFNNAEKNHRREVSRLEIQAHRLSNQRIYYASNCIARNNHALQIF